MDISTVTGAVVGFVTAVFGAGVATQKVRATAREVVALRTDVDELSDTIPERLARIEGQLSILVGRLTNE